MESENAVVRDKDEIIKIASFEIGAFKQNEISWKVQEDAVCVIGKRTSVWNQHTEARVEGGRFCRIIPIPDQVCRQSINARFVGGGLFVVEGTKKIEKVKRKSSQAAYFDDMGFCVSVQVDGKPANLLSGESNNKIVSDSDTKSQSNHYLRSSNGSCSSFGEKKLPSFDSFEEDAELFFRDDPLDVILNERRDSLLLGKKQSSTTT